MVRRSALSRSLALFSGFPRISAICSRAMIRVSYGTRGRERLELDVATQSPIEVGCPRIVTDGTRLQESSPVPGWTAFPQRRRSLRRPYARAGLERRLALVQRRDARRGDRTLQRLQPRQEARPRGRPARSPHRRWAFPSHRSRQLCCDSESRLRREGRGRFGRLSGHHRDLSLGGLPARVAAL